MSKTADQADDESPPLELLQPFERTAFRAMDFLHRRALPADRAVAAHHRRRLDDGRLAQHDASGRARAPRGAQVRRRHPARVEPPQLLRSVHADAAAASAHAAASAGALPGARRLLLSARRRRAGEPAHRRRSHVPAIFSRAVRRPSSTSGRSSASSTSCTRARCSSASIPRARATRTTTRIRRCRRSRASASW